MSSYMSHNGAQSLYVYANDGPSGCNTDSCGELCADIAPYYTVNQTFPTVDMCTNS